MSVKLTFMWMSVVYHITKSKYDFWSHTINGIGQRAHPCRPPSVGQQSYVQAVLAARL